jgi:hypothetical protein
LEKLATQRLTIFSSKEVDKVFKKYPKAMQGKLLHLRDLILETAKNSDTIHEIEETLKWGEPSYLTKIGSTIRIDWKEKTPEQYAIYFKCTSKLVPTFRAVFPDKFNFEANRAIIFHMEEKVPETELKKCIAAALTYHKVKHLPLLGM